MGITVISVKYVPITGVVIWKAEKVERILTLRWMLRKVVMNMVGGLGLESCLVQSLGTTRVKPQACLTFVCELWLPNFWTQHVTQMNPLVILVTPDSWACGDLCPFISNFWDQKNLELEINCWEQRSFLFCLNCLYAVFWRYAELLHFPFHSTVLTQCHARY
jgi:hypothetical protein